MEPIIVAMLGCENSESSGPGFMFIIQNETKTAYTVELEKRK